MAHFAAHRNRGRIFEIVAAKDAHRVKGPEHDILFVVRARRIGGIRFRWCPQRVAQIEGDDLRRVVRRIQPDDLRMARGRLRQQVCIGMNKVGDPHAFAIGVLAGMKDVAVEINGLLAVGQQRRDANFVSILNFESFKSLGRVRLIVVLRQIILR